MVARRPLLAVLLGSELCLVSTGETKFHKNLAGYESAMATVRLAGK